MGHICDLWFLVTSFTFVDNMKADPTRIIFNCVTLYDELKQISFWSDECSYCKRTVFSTLHNANNTKTSTGTNRKVSLQSKSFGWEKSLSGEKSFGGEKSMGRKQWGEINGEKSMERNLWGEISQ